MAKSTVAMCVPTVSEPTPSHPTTTATTGRADLEGALKREGTKVIRLADPAHLPVEVYTIPRATPSPAISATSGSSNAHLGVPGTSTNGHANANANANGNNARLSLGGVNGTGALGYGYASGYNNAYNYAYNSSSSGHGHDHESRMGIAIGGSPTPSGTDDGRGLGISGTGVGVGVGAGVDSALVDREGETMQDTVLYVPGHPYAQGGLSFAPAQSQSQAQSQAQAQQKTGAKEPSKVPTIDEIISKHKVALPHIPLHPYALGSRDSYLESYGLVGQYRNTGNGDGDATRKMWAQLSPGGVQEILSPELKQYSPYANLELGSPVGQDDDGEGEEGGKAREVDGDTVDQRTIHDTVGVGEALVNATRPRGVRERVGERGSKESGHAMPMPIMTDSISRAYASSPFHQDMHLSPDDADGEGQSISITPRSGLSTRILGSPSDLEGFQDLFYRPPEEEEEEERRRRQTPRENALPETPGAIGADRETVRPLSESPVPWNGGSVEGESRREVPAMPHAPPVRRTDSGLTSLARQLNEEFEQMALEREREQMGMRYSRSPSVSLSDAIMHSRQGSLGAIAPATGPLQYSQIQKRQHQSQSSRSSSRGMTMGSTGGEPGDMQFIFEEASSATNVEDEDGERERGARMRMMSPIQAFMPSGRTIPEDVHSSLSREEGSSVGHGMVDEDEDDNDPTAVFRVGIIGSVSTPPPVSPAQHRLSFNAEMHDIQHAHRDFVSPATRARILSNLTAPFTEATRSSYMTTSTMSRMSGLSDFPIPPTNPSAHSRPTSKAHLSMHQGTLTTPAATSLLTSYFDEAHYQRETEDEGIPEIPPPPASLLQERQLTFGGNQDADELVKSLSGGALPSSDTVVPTMSSFQK
ncbi:hypothetical protein CVT24_000687 [Panaeolus cyanescens]|uniref:Uncharacterized protein n=1 Tax=Panaeolus cyanescens TaxID=181874 RepID=A0A409VWH0_9AGAR|nr:hypothetical protein CVT24_000687 [Panaeolus cyanescens]